MCVECYVIEKRITPLKNAQNCLKNHTQYICGTCGRCICIEKDKQRGVQRWNFPFQTLEKAIMYLRTADYTMKTNCGIYEIQNSKGRKSYKIFANIDDLKEYLKKHKDKSCDMLIKFQVNMYKEYPHTQIRKLTSQEVEIYLKER
ncbi:MAG: hypothetical protein K2P09_05675 [Erysipelotrichales bacterium]|nr:hypothetical protein [Erysipelotrichales bacterium]